MKSDFVKMFHLRLKQVQAVTIFSGWSFPPVPFALEYILEVLIWNQKQSKTSDFFPWNWNFKCGPALTIKYCPALLGLRVPNLHVGKHTQINGIMWVAHHVEKNTTFNCVSFFSVVHVLSNHIYVSSALFSISLAIVS